MSLSKPPEPQGQEILDKLAALEASGQLQKTVRNAEHFTKQDEDSAHIAHRLRVNWHRNGIMIVGMWALFVCAVFVVGLLGWMLAAQVNSIVYSDTSRANALSWLLTTVLTVGATLFVERNVIQKKRK